MQYIADNLFKEKHLCNIYEQFIFEIIDMKDSVKLIKKLIHYRNYHLNYVQDNFLETQFNICSGKFKFLVAMLQFKNLGSFDIQLIQPFFQKYFKSDCSNLLTLLESIFN